ncbi:MAG TPA: ImmA/IrrE family metallo-endopeptidase [Candidatus Saccharicenans sp.]|nr:ImmA/IrrE family metallo-endopeptidase [Candidatus Saccharicenans sp.]
MTITQEELARRLKEAREKARFTQDQVASALGLVRPVIAQIEAGKRKVSSLELAALARLYGRPIHSFFEEAFEAEGISYILRAVPEVRSDHQIQEGMNRGLEIINAILDLEKKLGVNRLSSGPLCAYDRKMRTRWDAVEQGQEIASQERNRLGLGVAPVGDPASLLDAQGILILGMQLPPGLSGFTFRSGQATICVINSTEPLVRQRYSVIHEYCHALCDLNDLPAIVSREEGKKDLREVRADVFAACFLMPENAVREFLKRRGKAMPSRIQGPLMVKDKVVSYAARRGSGKQSRQSRIDYLDVADMARYFGVSVDASIWRLRELNLINEKEKDLLLEEDRSPVGKAIKDILRKKDSDKDSEKGGIFQNATEHLFYLAVEAARGGLISRNKLIELLELAGLQNEDIYAISEVRRTT